MSGKNALAFVAGLGSGYLTAQQRGRDQERQDKQDAWQAEQQDWQRQDQQQKTSLRRGLADATAPAAVNESGATLGLADGTKTVYDSADVAGSDFRQLRRADEATGNQTLERATLADGKSLSPAAAPAANVGLASSLDSELPVSAPEQPAPAGVGLANGRDASVAMAPRKAVTMNGKAFDGTVPAKAAADAYNAPDAVVSRQSQVYRNAGQPDKAMALESGALSQKREQTKFTQEQEAYAEKLKSEGVFQAVRAFRMGDASGMVKAFNHGGQYKLDGDPVITKEERDVPGVGKIPTYTATMRMVGPDGKVTEVIRNSHDMSMQIMPYEKALELQRKGSDSDNKFTNQQAALELKGKQVELQGELGLARIATASARSNGQPSREERLRYTSLFNNASQRMGEAQKTLRVLQTDRRFMRDADNPASPQAAQLKDLTDSIAAFKEERSLYQGMLAGSQSDGKQAAPAKPAGLASGRPAAPSVAKPDFSKLWK